MILHTRTPSKEEYDAVCIKLIQKYPTLKDEIGSSGYVGFFIILYSFNVCMWLQKVQPNNF